MTDTTTRGPVAILPKQDSLVLRPLPDARAAAPRSPGLGWWIGIAIILTLCVVFQAKIGPAERFALHEGEPVPPTSFVHQQVLVGFTPLDIVVFGFAYLAALHRLRRGYTWFSRRVFYITLICTLAIVGGLASGIYHGTVAPFGDWRYIVTGAAFGFALWSTVMRDQQAPLRFAQILVAVCTIYGAWRLGQYMAGGGERAFFGRIPLGDHAKIEFMVASVAVSLAMIRLRYSPLLWYAGIAVGTAVVLLSFRRYAWVELAVVFGVFLAFGGGDRRKYIQGAAAVLAVAGLAVALTWESAQWEQRIDSLDPRVTKTENELAATNEGHLDDIRDGIDQVQMRPIFGLGVGVTYIGERTSSWKGAAGMVHNAILELWIEFGLFGVLVYLGCYVLLFREILRRRKQLTIPSVLALGAGAFIFANFMVTATIYGWVYSHAQQSILIFGLLAAAFPASRLAPQPADETAARWPPDATPDRELARI
jgi:O-antigen ligase